MMKFVQKLLNTLSLRLSYSIVFALGGISNILAFFVGRNNSDLQNWMILGILFITYSQLALLFYKVKVDQTNQRKLLREEQEHNKTETSGKLKEQKIEVFRSLEVLQSEMYQVFEEIKTEIRQTKETTTFLQTHLDENIAQLRATLSQISQGLEERLINAEQQNQMIAEQQNQMIGQLRQDVEKQFIEYQENFTLTLGTEFQKLHEIDVQELEQRENLQQQLHQTNEHLTHMIETERSQRIASFARRDSALQLPENVLILLTVPRSGSTWLMDMLRCHPHIHLDPASIIFEMLHLKGGRYPLGLSNTPDSIMDFENTPGRGNKIPVFPLPPFTSPIGEAKPFSLEKIHPMFFEHKPEDFLEKIIALELDKGINFKFIYQVRDPKAVCLSFLNYQKRDPKWLPNITPDKLPQLMLKEYTTIYELACQRPEFIVDYPDLRTETHQTLIRLYHHLWKEEDNLLATEFANFAISHTQREERQKQTPSKFLGEKEGPIDGSKLSEANEQFFELYAEDMERIYEPFYGLLGLTEEQS